MARSKYTPEGVADILTLLNNGMILRVFWNGRIGRF